MSVHELTLDQLGSVARGRSRHRPRDAAFLYGGPFPFVQTGDVKRAGLYLREYEQTYSEAGLAQSKLWPVGTLCITIAANIADTAILDIEACFPDSVIGFTANPAKADTRFVKYLFDSVLKMRLRSFTQGAAQDNLSQEKLLSIKFSVPAPATQKRIADVLSAYDGLIENNSKRIALLEEAARLLYREWFVHLRFPGHEHVKLIDGVPEGWERRPLAACATFQSGGTPSRARAEFWQGNVPWISSGELTSMRVSTSTQFVTDAAVRAGSRYADVGTILGVVRGMSLAKEFRLGVVSKRVCFNQDLKAFVPDRGIESLYLFHSLDEQRERIRQSAGQASHGTKKLETAVLGAVEIPVATATLRRLFVEYASSVHSLVDVLAEQTTKLERARSLLLPRLMNGELAV